jgi:hypothetical protein
LFVLAIDPLQRIIEAAAKKEILKPILPKMANLCCSLYADDAAIFTEPTALELDRLLRILHFFGECSSLKINLSETEVFPIRVDNNTITQLLQNFPGKTS